MARTRLWWRIIRRQNLPGDTLEMCRVYGISPNSGTAQEFYKATPDCQSSWTCRGSYPVLDGWSVLAAVREASVYR